jgi:nitroreductase
MDEPLQYIFRRRSIRSYQDKPVEKEKLEILLKATMAAPSATNSQPWEFVVIDDPDRMQGLRNILPYGKFVAPAAIAVCGSPKVATNPSGRMFWIQDCSAAAENILLGAFELGLGACWIGVNPIPIVKQAVARYLGLPGGVTPLCMIYLGYPKEQKEARTRYDAKKVHWQKYGSQPHLKDKA